MFFLNWKTALKNSFKVPVGNRVSQIIKYKFFEYVSKDIFIHTDRWKASTPFCSGFNMCIVLLNIQSNSKITSLGFLLIHLKNITTH